MRSWKCLFLILLCCTLTGCAMAQPAMSDSLDPIAAPDSDTEAESASVLPPTASEPLPEEPAVEDAPAKPLDPELLAQKEAEFIAMANHDNYITGTLVDGYLGAHSLEERAKTYLIVQTDAGDLYRVEGYDGELGRTNTPLSIATTRTPGLWGMERLLNQQVLIFFDPEQQQDTYTIDHPKEIDFLPQVVGYRPPEEVIQHAQAQAQVLIDNMLDIPDRRVFTPEDAILAVIDHMELEKAERTTDVFGGLCYQAGAYQISVIAIWYNENYGSSAADSASAQAAAPPYIKYIVSVDNDINPIFYRVSLDGTVEDG